MQDQKYRQTGPTTGTRIGEWIGLTDRKAGAVLFGTLLFFVLFLGVLPHWLKGQAAEDLRGVPAQTARGYVSAVLISPVSQGGGGLFNAVDVTFAGRTGYYALPRRSTWKPAYKDTVVVTYRVGRNTGLVHVDQVTPD